MHNSITVLIFVLSITKSPAQGYKLREKDMSTKSHPRTLEDIRYQDNVLYLSSDQTVSTEAHKWFKETFDTEDEPTVNFLFMEDGKRVWEAYTDSGSVDYLYIVQ